LIDRATFQTASGFVIGMNISDNMVPVSDLVRTYDRDRYLAGLFAPKHARDALMALYAFNCELERIPALVSEPALGEIRLQWWRDALEGVEPQKITGNPVADTLIGLIRRHDLSRHAFQGMIDARSADLDGGGFVDLTALKAYLYKTQGALLSLAASILNIPATNMTPFINPAAEAYGLMRILRRLPHDAAAGLIMLPLSSLAENGLTPEDILSGESQGVSKAVSDLSVVARDALEKCREGLAGSPRDICSVFAPLSVVEPNLCALEKTGVRPLQDVTEINPLMQFFRIWRCSRTGRI